MPESDKETGLTSEKARRERVRGRLLGWLPKQAHGAEVGVWEGDFSQRILEICEPRRLHLIDPWLYLPEFPNTGFGRKRNEHLMEDRFRKVSERFSADDRVVIHRATSEVALSAMPDAALDWIYLDGNHNDPFIGQDLELALRKVKPNGMIAGDDYNWQADAQGAPVKRAVEAIMLRLGSQATLKVIANQYLIRLRRS